ncbi:S1 family peptidase [Pseudomonas viridiflava]|uniref:S1 family peptidase n=1 Tax=Pseudomonas viridiflava TaxID=33069 RepID=UPI000F05EE80|nr:serine protease [Pseudomonas viridiflava]
MYKKIEGAIYATGTEIVRFFAVDIDNISQIKTVQMFIDQREDYNEKLDMSHFVISCENLVRSGVLMEMSSGLYIEDRTYIAANYHVENASYGEYDFLAEGFGEVAKRLGPSVLPVVVQKKSGDEDLGTAFLLGNFNTLLTARHVVENMASLKILGPDGCGVTIHNVYVSFDENIDIALLIVSFENLFNLTPLRVGDAEILTEILSIGYPPIPGFDTVRIYDRAEINSFVRYSRGRIVSQASSYLDKQDFILFNARVKGGSSGGPILNALGHVLGMLVQIPMAADDSQKIDSLGYGVAVPNEAILDALEYPHTGRELKISKAGEFEYSTSA